ncbi:protein O-mannosyl-transferase Tmtc3-like [Centruroides vittatus]|uniref:protein O-mannosyl-transferase Tmtc3-like n=1 Tax=Centruroides vittatus TaxID=120091 RepID=UPI003510832F
MDLNPLILVTLAIGCYYNSLHCQLVFDDIAAIKENRDVLPHTPIRNIFFNDFWGTPLIKEHSHKSYRPLTVFTYRLNYSIHQLDAFGYHLVNVVLHAIVCLLYYRICLLFLPSKTSFIASVLFAVHPIHTEAVTSVVGRAELLSAIFYLFVLRLYITQNRKSAVNWLVWFGIISLSIVGFLCKEQSITVLVVCIIFEFSSLKIPSIKKSPNNLSSFHNKLFRMALLFLASGSIIWIRISLMGSRLPKFNRFDNPASVSKFPDRQMTYNFLSVLNFGLLLYPLNLCCDWSMGTVPLVTSFWDIRNLGTVCLYVGLFAIMKTSLSGMRFKKSLVMGIAMTVAPYIPSSNLFFPVGFVVAERTLYLPSMGYCILVAVGWNALMEFGFYKTIFRWGLWLLILSHVVRTNRRNEDWRTEYTLYDSALKFTQKNAKLYNNMGRVLEGQGKNSEAIHYFKSAIKVESNDVRGYLNLGRILTKLENYEEAEKIYLMAKSHLEHQLNSKQTSVTRSHLQVLLHLASLISLNRTRLQEADQLYQRAISIKSDYSDAYFNRGNVLLKMNKTKEAEMMYHKALQLDSENPDIYSNLATVLMLQKRKEEALEYLNKALIIQPDHQKALMNSAMWMEEDEKNNWHHLSSERLTSSEKNNGETFFQLAMTYLSEKDLKNAEIWLKRAIESEPHMKNALFNLALLLSDENRPMESLVYIKQLLKFYPDHIKGLILLADINVNYLKDLDSAEQCYAKVLLLEPNNLQSLHNTCVIHLKRTQYQKAADCFYNVSNLYPSVDYVHRHLQLTRELLRNEVNVNFPKQ